MAVLYQKYRPQNFSEIFGQNHIKITLQNEIINNSISHAYMFCGPRAVGKTTLARVFSKAINCEKRKDKEFEPCNKCNACLSINNFNNLDVIEIDAASNTGVDNVRDNVISLSRVKSSNNKYKVFIIDEIHMLSLSAFNALLKTLEEPPANVIFILCTTEIYKVPLTIISRCERFDFKRISVNDMMLKLEKIVKSEKLKVDRDVLELIALKSDGHLRDAESLLSQIIAVSSGPQIDLASANLVVPYNNIQENIKLLESLSKKDAFSAIKIINDLINNGINLKNFINDLIELLRKMILNKVNDSLASSLGLDLSEKLEIKIAGLNKNFSLDDLIKISEEFIKSSQEISLSPIAQMPLELAVISICHEAKNTFSEIKKDDKIKEDLNFNTSVKNQDVDKKWNEFLTKLKPHNHSLSFIMQSCKVNGIKGSSLCLSFKYKFHKERLESPEIKSLIESVLKDVYEQDLKVETMLDESLELNNNTNKNNDKIINDLLTTFGGQIIG